MSDVVASFATSQYASHTFLFNSHSSKPGEAKKIEKALWRFGDGTHAYGGILFHQFAKAGVYKVRLTVTNGFGQSAGTARYDHRGQHGSHREFSGRFFNDKNFNGVRSKKENWLQSQTIYLDANNNARAGPR